MILRLLALILTVLSGSAAQAHLLPAQNATMNIIGTSAYFVVSAPVSALKDVDDDGNSMLSVAEMQRHRADITTQFEARFHVADGGKSGNTALTWLVPPQTDDPIADSTYVIILQRINFATAINQPVITTDLFGTGKGEAQITMTATRDKASEVAILEPGAGSHQFYLGSWAIFTDFLRIGVEHILTGLDHLLFLLTIIIAAAGWRYWLGVVTSFTVAHSITLSFSALNIIRIPTSIVEPGIALSIMIMALLNLRAVVSKGWARIAIVFACGLLHGFGFASAIGSMAVDTSTRIASLAGFNVGIEMGQFAFVGAVLLTIYVAEHVGQIRVANQLSRFASLAAAGLGFLLFTQRLGLT